MKKVTITLVKTGQTQTVTCEDNANTLFLIMDAAKDFGLKPYRSGTSMSAYFGRFQVKVEKVEA